MKKKSIQNRYKSKLILEELEARQLFSGGAEGVIPPPDPIPAPTAVNVDANVEPVAENQTQAPVSQSTIEPTVPEASTSIQDNIAALTNPAETIQRHEIAFVDSNVEGYQQLIDDIKAGGKANTQLDIIILDSRQNGITQITDTLANYKNLAAVHLIAHGSDGSVDIGNNQLNFSTMVDNQEAISQWGNAFSANGDFLIYGCNVAQTQFGQSFC